MNPSKGHRKRLKFFQKPADTDVSYHFAHELPRLPADAKHMNIQIDENLDYQMTDLELDRSRLLFYVNPLLDMDMVDDSLYEIRPRKNMQFTEEETELADFWLNFDLKSNNDCSRDTTESKEDSSYNFEAVYGNEVDDDRNLIKKLKLKGKKKNESRYRLIADDGVSMYLRKSSLITAGSTSQYGQTKVEPTKTFVDESIKDNEIQYLMSGDKMTQNQKNTLTKMIDETFNDVKEAKVGMEKPMSNGQVTATKCYDLWPNFDMAHHSFYVSNYYNPEQIKGKTGKNMETVLKKVDENDYELFEIQNNEDEGQEHTDSIQYRKIGDYRFNNAQKDNKMTNYVVWWEDNKATYVPVDTQTTIIQQKKGFSFFDRKLKFDEMVRMKQEVEEEPPEEYFNDDIMNSDQDDKQKELQTSLGQNTKPKKPKKLKKNKLRPQDVEMNITSEEKSLFLNQRDYTQKELDRRVKSFRKWDFPVTMDVGNINIHNPKSNKRPKPVEGIQLKAEPPKPPQIVNPDFFYKKKVVEASYSQNSQESSRVLPKVEPKLVVDAQEIIRAKGRRKKVIDEDSSQSSGENIDSEPNPSQPRPLRNKSKPSSQGTQNSVCEKALPKEDGLLNQQNIKEEMDEEVEGAREAESDDPDNNSIDDLF